MEGEGALEDTIQCYPTVLRRGKGERRWRKRKVRKDYRSTMCEVGVHGIGMHDVRSHVEEERE